MRTSGARVDPCSRRRAGDPDGAASLCSAAAAPVRALSIADSGLGVCEYAPGMAERRLARTLASLDDLFAFVAEFVAACDLDESRGFDVALVLEELFTNQVKYNPEGAPAVEVGLRRDGSTVVVWLRDFDVEPFDPTRAPVVDISRPLSERQAGGLGLHLVRRVADRVDYDYRDRCSTITVTLTVES